MEAANFVYDESFASRAVSNARACRRALSHVVDLDAMLNSQDSGTKPTSRISFPRSLTKYLRGSLYTYGHEMR